MSDFLQRAQALAKRGFHVFPLKQESKLPAISEFPEVASSDPNELGKWWLDSVMDVVQPLNVGISTSKFNGGKSALLVVDVDVKGEKRGDETMLKLEMEGFEFPKTCTQTTPTGGLHLIYKVPVAVKQGVEIFGKGSGLDTRSRGGYIVGAGSYVEAGEYTIDETPIADAPQWLIDKCGMDAPKKERKEKASKADQKLAIKRAIDYLTTAEVAIEGQGGDQTTFKIACRMKDLGLTATNAFNVLWENWNPNCSPPWTAEDLKTKIGNAYAYGQASLGADAPETQFDIIEDPEELERQSALPASGAPSGLHPFDQLNKEFAFVIEGGGSHILWETTDDEGNPKVVHLSEQAFHKKFAAHPFDAGRGKPKTLTEAWMASHKRRSYDGICFSPGLEVSARFYNLWRGFSVELPEAEGSQEAKDSLAAFLSHAKENVCKNEPELFHWLMGFFAHLVQRPWEKPLVALVFKGRKGVGKNACINQVAQLIRSHSLITANRRYLAGNFNSHLENLLLFVLDEAFWSGDKPLEGIVKDLITGERHVIEHKGQEPYTVANRARIVIIGNEDWVVPASEDERRYAVFNIGEGRKQDRAFFSGMAKGMRNGGHALLLEYLMNYDLTGIDVNDAPLTKGLLEQKIESLSPFHQWMFACLAEGDILGLDLATDDAWPEEIEKEAFRIACQNYLKSRNIRTWMPDSRSFGHRISKCIPSIVVSRKQDDGNRFNTYRLPSLAQAREEWERFMGQKIAWETAPLPGKKEELKSDPK